MEPKFIAGWKFWSGSGPRLGLGFRVGARLEVRVGLKVRVKVGLGLG
jgi:hypothetical protein